MAELQKPTSIDFSQSLKDWWGSSAYLQKPALPGPLSPQTSAARDQNRRIEYDLFRAILSEDVELIASGEEPTGLIYGSFLDIPITEDGLEFIHEFEIINASDLSLSKRHIVIIHGYMAAMGYFVKNFEELAKSYGNIAIHAIDMPGFGNSSRPKFPSTLLRPAVTKQRHIQKVLDTENWMIDRFEVWRKQRGIDHFHLLAHSMGAYLASCYLMKYNKQNGKTLVKNFMIISPMGSEASNASLVNNPELQKNFHEPGAYPLEEIFADQDFEDNETPELVQLWHKIGGPKFPKNGILRTMWGWGFSPFQLLQCLGPMYSKLLSYWSFRRFKNVRTNDQNDDSVNTDLILKLHKYSYSIFNQYQGSGELAITQLVNHEVLARLPLSDRGFLENIVENDVRTLWLYGDKDWMNMRGGEYCVEKLKKLESKDAELLVVENAGHHIYLDNPEKFNAITVDFLKLNQPAEL